MCECAKETIHLGTHPLIYFTTDQMIILTVRLSRCHLGKVQWLCMCAWRSAEQWAPTDLCFAPHPFPPLTPLHLHLHNLAPAKPVTIIQCLCTLPREKINETSLPHTTAFFFHCCLIFFCVLPVHLGLGMPPFPVLRRQASSSSGSNTAPPSASTPFLSTRVIPSTA